MSRASSPAVRSLLPLGPPNTFIRQKLVVVPRDGFVLGLGICYFIQNLDDPPAVVFSGALNFRRTAGN